MSNSIVDRKTVTASNSIISNSTRKHVVTHTCLTGGQQPKQTITRRATGSHNTNKDVVTLRSFLPNRWLFYLAVDHSGQQAAEISEGKQNGCDELYTGQRAQRNYLTILT